DHAAPRYIFTKLSPAARCIFPAEDDPVLEYQSEEGQRIEPRWYCPVIPLVLVNGSEGIGVGWSTSVPNYNPRDLIANVRRHLRGEPLEPMTPWYRGFRGTVAATDKPGRYETVGVAQRHGSTRIEVTELPVRKWTQDYKEWIMDQLQADDGKRATISEFREYHTDNTVHFSLAMLPDKVALAEGRGLEKFFHLKSTISTTNMHLFDASGKLKKYESPEEILQDFAKVRLEQYGKRKEYCIEKLQKEVATLTDKAKFIRLVVDGELEIADRASQKVCNDMKRFGLRTKQEIEAGVEEKPHAARNSRRLRAVIDVTDTDVDLAGPQGYEYLLKLKLWTLTEERLEALQRQLASKRQELEDLKATSLEQLWEMDLVRLESALDVVEAEERKEQQEAARLMKKAGYFEDDASVNRQCVLVVSDGFSQIKRIRTDKWKAVRRGGAGKSIAGHKKKKAKDAPASGDEGEEEEMEADGDEELPDAISAAAHFHSRDLRAMAAIAMAILTLHLWNSAGERAELHPRELLRRPVTKQVCLLQSQRDMQKIFVPVNDTDRGHGASRILYSIGAGLHQLPALQACLETWASKLGEGEIQVIGLDAKDSPVEAKTVLWDAARECPDSHEGGACKDAVGLANAYERGVDWVVLLGTDNYVLPAHFEKALMRFDPADPLILGIRGCGMLDCPAGGLCGGGGQVFSRAALKSFLAQGREAFLQEQRSEAQAIGGWGDVANCRVAAKRDIPIRNLVGLHAWEVDESKLHKRDLTFHYVSAAAMYEMDDAHGKHLHKAVLFETGVLDSSSYIRDREAYVEAENMRRNSQRR
ncbi:TOP2, partial [Symbiodinium microadriaticum]